MPWWGVLSAAAALVFLVGGCTVATALQPPSFNWLASTVSTLTEREAADPWVMTAAFAVTGACEMATALALQPAAMPGRLILAAAGAAVATLLALIAWYLMELTTKGGMTGLAERIMGTAEVGWPLAVVLSCRRPAKQGS